jgi:hypothetical protein
MSTPATEPAPFDPHAFPPKLIEAQRKAAELYAALRAHQAVLPWSREPHPGWPEESERGKERSGRPASPGWTDQQAAKFDWLMKELREATAVVQTHAWWKRCTDEGIEGPAIVRARQALKHADGAVPLAREGIDAAA